MPRPRRAPGRPCTVSGCTRELYARALCELHYKRMRTRGSVDLLERPVRICAADDCTRDAKARGLCSMHYKRWHAKGTTALNARRSEMDRFYASYSVNDESGCWTWTAARSDTGYGTIMCDSGRNMNAHRFAYLRLRGEIPKDLQIDHLCRNRACVNPDHLEPVTRAVNVQRGSASKLSEAEALEIMRLRNQGEMCKDIAARFGVHASHVSRVSRGINWASLEGES